MPSMCHALTYCYKYKAYVADPGLSGWGRGTISSRGYHSDILYQIWQKGIHTSLLKMSACSYKFLPKEMEGRGEEEGRAILEHVFVLLNV